MTIERPTSYEGESGMTDEEALLAASRERVQKAKNYLMGLPADMAADVVHFALAVRSDYTEAQIMDIERMIKSIRSIKPWG